jgi:hypothetical protein
MDEEGRRRTEEGEGTKVHKDREVVEGMGMKYIRIFGSKMDGLEGEGEAAKERSRTAGTRVEGKVGRQECDAGEDMEIDRGCKKVKGVRRAEERAKVEVWNEQLTSSCF